MKKTKYSAIQMVKPSKLPVKIPNFEQIIKDTNFNEYLQNRGIKYYTINELKNHKIAWIDSDVPKSLEDFDIVKESKFIYELQKEGGVATEFYIGKKQCPICNDPVVGKIYSNKDLNEILEKLCDKCHTKTFYSEKIRPAHKPEYEVDGKIVKVLSCGWGVDSVYEVIHHGHEYDVILFSDTGAEQPETYAYIEYAIKKLPRYIRNRIVILTDHVYGKGIYDFYFDKKAVPVINVRRDCTGKYKISPIRRYLRKTYGLKAKFEMSLCIAYDEADRMSDSGLNYIENRYPLVERKLTRQDCIDGIKNAGWFIPSKSGCTFCPYTSKKGWEKQATKHPDIYTSSKRLYENSGFRKEFVKFNEEGNEDAICACVNGKFNLNEDGEYDLSEEDGIDTQSRSGKANGF